MSILDKIRGVKRAASQHKAKGSKSDDAKPVVEPYKHIPTHAAIDALSGAPSSWKAEDRTAIIAQHKRRSAMSRQNSGLSTVTTINRGNSFNTTEWTTTTTDQRRHRPAYQSMIVPEERHERRHPISREISPVDSSDNSTSTTSSRDSSYLEIPFRHPVKRYSDANVFDHIHKSTTRKIGEAPMHASPPARPQMNTSVKIEPKRKSWGFTKTASAVEAH